MFEPIAFKGHVLNCRHLESLREDAAANSINDYDSQRLVVKASQVDIHGYIKFLVGFCGLSWYTQV